MIENVLAGWFCLKLDDIGGVILPEDSSVAARVLTAHYPYLWRLCQRSSRYVGGGSLLTYPKQLDRLPAFSYEVIL